MICADLDPTPKTSPSLSDPPTIPTHELINSNGGHGYFRQLDVVDREAFEEVIHYAVEEVSPRKRLDIIVNNAGKAGLKPDTINEGIHTEDPDYAESIFKVNITCVWNGTRAAVIQMLKQDVEPFPCDLDVEQSLGDILSIEPERGSRGVIVNIGSLHGLVAGPSERELFLHSTIGSFPWKFLTTSMLLAAYSASKAAVINLSRAVACDYAKHRINCNSICPGCKYEPSSLPYPPFNRFDSSP